MPLVADLSSPDEIAKVAVEQVALAMNDEPAKSARMEHVREALVRQGLGAWANDAAVVAALDAISLGSMVSGASYGIKAFRDLLGGAGYAITKPPTQGLRQ